MDMNEQDTQEETLWDLICAELGGADNDALLELMGRELDDDCDGFWDNGESDSD